MLILLPPSEGKSPAASGPPLDLGALSFPSLTTSRRAVLTELIRMCRDDSAAAADVLGLGPTQQGDVLADARLRRAPCAPAIEVYTGVLYENLDAASLAARAHRRLQDHVAISSALWGLLRPGDLIPAYRLSAGVRLPGLGSLTTRWRDPVADVLRESDGLILDLRSGAYVTLAPLPRDLAGRAATVRVLTERNGKRTVVSHSNKATKGLIVRALAEARNTPADVDRLASTLARAGFRIEVDATAARDATPGHRGAPQVPVLDVILDS